jgi:hypothetical protein
MRSVALVSVWYLDAARRGLVNSSAVEAIDSASSRVLHLQTLEAMLRLSPREEIASP